MTNELQKAKARYEEARIAYKRAVLASLNGDAGGEAIREAIRSMQDASSALSRITGQRGRPVRPLSPPPANERAAEPTRFGLGFVRRLLAAG